LVIGLRRQPWRCVDTCFAVREGGERCWWVGVGVGVDVS
jgi:hypothetical protein